MASRHRGTVLRQLERVFSLGTLSGMTEEQLLEHFAARHDEAAFEALIARHGPMVWGLCRRLLRDPHDAEDAFQATFLVLLRKAGTLREPGQLSPWLYGVAFRVASRVRSDPARRRTKEGRGAKPEAVVSDVSREADGLRSAIDEEVNRLPEKYRRPVVLCHLEGLTYEEAARQLQWTTGMVKGRLAQARERLRGRLTARGLAPSVGVAGPWIFPEVAPAAVPQALVTRTAEVAAHIATAASASILALAEGTIRTMLFTKLKAAAALLAVGTLTLMACAFALAQTGGEAPQAVTAPVPEQTVGSRPSPVGAGRSMEFRVVEPGTDRGIPGVQLTIRAGKVQTRATTDEAGRYWIRGIPPETTAAVTVWAKKDGLVPKSITWRGDSANSGLPEAYTLPMEPATTIGGLIRDEAGAPIAGAIVYIRADSGRGNGVPVTDVYEYPAKTDAQGRWHCDLIPAGPDSVSTRLVHPDYVSDQSYGDTPVPSSEQLSARSAVMVMIRGATLTGTVADAAGRPIPGAKVKLGTDIGSPQPPTTLTDAEGRYRFQVKPGSHVLTVQAKGHAPDLKRIPAVQGRKQVDFRLPPAQPFFGRIVDRQGRPVAGARVVVHTWRGYQTLEAKLTSDAEGRYRWDDAPADEVLVEVVKPDSMPIWLRPMTASPQGHEITLSPMLHVHGSVVDAETGQPIKGFKVVPGIVIGDAKPHWMYDKAKSATGGRYEIALDDPRTPHVRIEAEGYQPAVSRPFQDDEGDTVYDFKLQKGVTIAGIVRLPDGASLPKAQVILVTAGQGQTLNNGRLTQRDRNVLVETGPDGRFSFPAQDKDYAIVVLHDIGYGELSSRGLAADPVVTVRPWARIEGTYRIGSEPAVRQAIQAYRRRSALVLDAQPGFGPRAEPDFLHSTLTDDQGRFTLDRVPPGEFLVASEFRLPRGLTTASGQSATIDVQPGQTLSVSLGGKGQPVVGRIVLPKGSDRQVDWSYGNFHFETDLERPTPPKGLSEKEQTRWWYESRESKSYSKARHDFPVRIGADGAFRVEDVPAAPYHLSFQVYEPPSGNQIGSARVVGMAARKFVVPKLPGGRSDEPLDLGEIPLTLETQVGDPASGFQVPTLDGKTLSLADYRGKYVLLDFWATWCGPCLAETPHLKATFEAFGNDDRFAMIGLSLDASKDEPREYVAKQGLSWPQGFLGAWSQATLPAAYGVQGIPSIWLIGPDGKVVAMNLRGDQIKEAVSKALATPPEPGSSMLSAAEDDVAILVHERAGESQRSRALR